MFKTWTVRNLFVIASLAIVLLILGVVLAIQLKLKHIMIANEKSDAATKVVELTLNSKFHIVQIQQFLTYASLTGDLDGVKEAKDHLIELKKSMDALGILKPELKSMGDVVYAGAEELAKTGLEMVKAYLESGKEAGNVIMKRPNTGLDERSQDLEKKTVELESTILKDKQDADESLKNAEYSMRIWVIAISFLSILVVIFAQLIIYMRISPISNIILSVQNQALNVHGASQNIKQTANELSATTTQQAAAIQETVASSEEMASMLSQTTQQSARSLQISEDGKSKSEKALIVMERLGNAMDDIQMTNEKLESLVRLIEEIKSKTKVINDIVFETRLLSFNASIEAARAGVHGKGFAVVAEEVGKLATMSGKAADEIRTLLDSSTNEVSSIVRSTQEKVITGKNVSEECHIAFQETGDILAKIIESVNKIASAAKEQEVGIKQTNRAMVEMDQVSNSNSQTSEKLANQTEKLFDASNELDITILNLQRLVFGTEHTRHVNPVARPQSVTIKESKKVKGESSEISKEYDSSKSSLAENEAPGRNEFSESIEKGSESATKNRSGFKWKKSS